MSLTPDQIVDRMQLKRKMTSWRFIAVISLVLLILSLFAGKELHRVAVIDGEYIARVRIDGEIFHDTGRIEKLEKLAEDRGASAIILHVNSPGGTVVGGEALYNTVLRLAQNKPVAIVMEDIATSAGYMVAIAGDYLVAYNGTITGSIGVLSMSYEFTDLADKLGIKFHNFKTSPLKGGPLPTEKLSPEMEQSMYVTLHEIYNMFFNMVQTRREIDKNKLQAIANGDVYTGKQALELGLIDAIGDETTALKWLHTEKKINPRIKIRDIEVETVQTTLNQFLGFARNIANFAKTLSSSNSNLFF